MTTLAHTTNSIVADPYFVALRDHIVSATGLVFYLDRSDALAGHIVERLRKRGLGTCQSYLELLLDDAPGEAELDAMIGLLTIGETYFFRHRELFDALRDVALPEIIGRNRLTRRLRVWSAGCSTGPEAYSISILLRRDLHPLTEDWNISILGTDINRPFLSQAAEGRYEEWAFRGTSAELRRDCFHEEGRAWQIAERYQRGVTFQYHNLARHPFPSLVHNLAAFDLILCRNVLIYFAPDVVEQIVSKLAECLVPGGWLAIGHAEHGAKCLGALEAVNCPGATLYRKPPSQTASYITCSLREQGASRAPARTNNRGPYDPVRPANPFIEYESRVATQDVSDGNLGATSGNGTQASPDLSEIDKVRALADEGNLESALQLCDSLIVAYPLQANFHFYRALLLDQIAGHKAALESLNRAIYLDREFVLAHYYTGTTLLKLSNSVAAIKSFRNVQRLIAARDPAECLPNAEGMTIADLDELTQLHIETLEAA